MPFSSHEALGCTTVIQDSSEEVLLHLFLQSISITCCKLVELGDVVMFERRDATMSVTWCSRQMMLYGVLCIFVCGTQTWYLWCAICVSLVCHLCPPMTRCHWTRHIITSPWEKKVSNRQHTQSSHLFFLYSKIWSLCLGAYKGFSPSRTLEAVKPTKLSTLDYE